MKINSQKCSSPHADVQTEAARFTGEPVTVSFPLDDKKPARIIADKKQTREERKLGAFVRELAIIKAQCDAGMEPSITIAATCFFSKRSHATIYRDIKKRVLPTPMKIGRSSMLPFSVVKAYAAGALVGDAA